MQTAPFNWTQNLEIESSVITEIFRYFQVILDIKERLPQYQVLQDIKENFPLFALYIGYCGKFSG